MKQFLRGIKKNIGGFGIGVDIENITKFNKKKLPPHSPFLHKVFTKKELDYCFSKKNFPQHLAARYAGKEAVVKALNGLCEARLEYRQIEILNDERGAPVVKITNPSCRNLQVFLSLSHCDDKALAFAVIFK